MTIFHVIKYGAIPVSVSSLPVEVSKPWIDRIEAYRNNVIEEMSPEHIIHQQAWYMRRVLMVE